MPVTSQFYRRFKRTLTGLVLKLHYAAGCSDKTACQPKDARMKYIIFLAFVFIAGSANSQSLKDLLYSGKLKSDTGSLVKKTDDLSAKIDTSTRKPQTVKFNNNPIPLVADSVIVTTEVVAGNPVSLNADSTSYVLAPRISDSLVAAEPVNVTRDNNRIWKEYVDSLTSIVNSEVLNSKKIKSGTYSVLVEYEIGLEGQITVSNVSSFPENNYLTQQVRERITLGAPQLTPLLNSYGKPRKANRKQTISFTK